MDRSFCEEEVNSSRTLQVTHAGNSSHLYAKEPLEMLCHSLHSDGGAGESQLTWWSKPRKRGMKEISAWVHHPNVELILNHLFTYVFHSFLIAPSVKLFSHLLVISLDSWLIEIVPCLRSQIHTFLRPVNYFCKAHDLRGWLQSTAYFVQCTTSEHGLSCECKLIGNSSKSFPEEYVASSSSCYTRPTSRLMFHINYLFKFHVVVCLSVGFNKLPWEWWWSFLYYLYASHPHKRRINRLN